MLESGNETIMDTHVLYPFFKIDKDTPLNESILSKYLILDDSDVLSLLKSWVHHEDIVLSSLSKQLINRNLPKVKLQSIPFEEKALEKKKKRLKHTNLSATILDNFVFTGSVSNQTYISDQAQILLQERSGKINSIAKSIDYLDFEQFSKPIHKYYLCYPKSK